MNEQVRKSRWPGVLMGLWLSVGSAPVWAVTVTNINDSGAGSLRQAIVDTPAGGTIDFSVTLPNTITLTSGQLTLDKNLTITGPGAAQLAISGNNVTRVMQVNASVVVTLSGLTIRNGNAGFVLGGGIQNAGTLTVSNSTFSGNNADFSGGIHNAGTLTVSNSTFSGNSADGGGGIFNNGVGTLTVSTSTFSGNSAGNSGGGIFNNGGTLTVSTSTFSGNSAGNSGGGIFNNGGTLTVSASTFSGNSTNINGGGGGGGISIAGGTLTVSASTFSDNSAPGTLGGGGIFNNLGTVTVSATIIANSPSGNNCSGTGLTSQGDNISSDGTCFSASGPNNDRLTLDPLLNALGNNGGPTQTHALQNGSPAIDAVTVNTCPPPATDQRGNGFNRPAGAACDIGAFELGATPVELQEFVVE
jgi:hypothetical protein